MKVPLSVVTFLIPAFFGGCSLHQGLTSRSTTHSAVERRLDQALPPGSTRLEIETWLTQQGIEFSFTDLPFMRSTTENLSDTNYSGLVQGILRNTDRSLLVRGDIVLQFVLDKDGKLKERSVKCVGTGL